MQKSESGETKRLAFLGAFVSFLGFCLSCDCTGQPCKCVASVCVSMFTALPLFSLNSSPGGGCFVGVFC